MNFQVATAEEAALRATIQNYIDGFLSYDTTLLRGAFDGNAKLIATSEGKVEATATASWFARIDERRRAGSVQPPAKSLVSGIDQHGDAAVARVELEFPTYRFTDYLSLLKTEEGWKVVNKIYTMA